jgi:hypothetical protein
MLVNAYATHRAPPELDFPHQLRGRRDRSDPELARHVQGFMGFIMGGGRRQMSATRYHVLGHLERVHHHLAFEIDASQLGALGVWAAAANAILFLPDASVRAPDGKVLVAPDTGDAEPGAAVPYPADAIARKQRSEAALGGLAVRTPKSLPPVVAEVEVELRSAGEVAERCLALFACALRAESLASQQPIAVAELEQRLPRAFVALSPNERDFMTQATPPEQEIVNHAWRYEALAALVWTLGALDDELPPPTRTCDVPALAKLMLAADGHAFVAQAQLRPAGAILDALDLCYRLHWATTDARVKQAPMPAALDPGVVAERHYALNWITRFADADWDDVDTPT